MQVIGLDTKQFLIVFFLVCILLYVIKYLMALMDYTIYPIFVPQGGYKEMNYGIHSFMQLIPGKTILEYLHSGNLYQIVGNIILFMPFVLFMYIFLQKKKPIPIILMGVLASVLIELAQLIIDLVTKYPNRVFDVDDFILNTVGVVLATLVFDNIKRIKGIQTMYNKCIMVYHHR